MFSVALPQVGPNSEGLKCLKVFPELRELDLKDLEDADNRLVHLKGLKQIKEINLDRSSLTDAGMKHLAGLLQLETLTFGSTEVGDGGLKQITGLKNLQWLEFGGNKKITDQGLAAIRDLTQLQRLYLDAVGSPMRV